MFATLKYVPHARVEEYLAQGWTVADTFAGLHHGHYAVLMEAPFPASGGPDSGRSDDWPYDDPRDADRRPTSDIWSV